jgi:hypothetical protein
VAVVPARTAKLFAVPKGTTVAAAAAVPVSTTNNVGTISATSAANAAARPERLAPDVVVNDFICILFPLGLSGCAGSDESQV